MMITSFGYIHTQKRVYIGPSIWKLLKFELDTESSYIPYFSTHTIASFDKQHKSLFEKAAHRQHLNPWQTERTMMRINAIRIPKTINLIFMFCSHIFLRICVPVVLKSCACLQNWFPRKNWKERTPFISKKI